ncbi:MAG: amidohydrolase [Thaumarchaeota archaeon]|nr:amidohydrolase [Nitrososphaerota archaeon]
MASLKIENASWIITVDPKRRILRNASILIEDREIKQVDKTEKLKNQKADKTIDGTHRIVTPGFFNNHMHISYAHAVRGIFPDDLPHQTYLSYVFKLQSAMTPEEEYYTSLLATTELLKNGCTTIVDPGTIKDLDSGIKAIEQSGIRAIIGKEATDMVNPLNIHVADTKQAKQEIEEVIRRYDKKLNGRLRAWAMPFHPNYCSDELLSAAKEIADKHGVGVTTHIAGNEEQTKSFTAQRGNKPITHLSEKGILGPNVLLAHALAVSDEEIDILAKTDTKIVHCPPAAVRGSGATKLGKFPEMVAKGVCVSLGNDAANSAYYLDLIRTMYLAAVLYKDARQDRRLIPPETALEMGTINGAKALGLDGITGSIEPGKKADLVLFNTRRPEWRSLFNPVNSLIYAADGRSVDTVLVDGKIAVESQRATYVSEDELYDKVQQIGEDLLRRTGVSFKYPWPVE